MRELPAINCHWVKAYYSVSICTWAVLVIICLHIFLEFTTMLLLFLFSLHVYRHSFLLNLPCWSSQHPCIAEMLSPIQSLSCCCFPSIPNFESQLTMPLFHKLYSIMFCTRFAHLNQHLSSYFRFREHTRCSEHWNKSCNMLWNYSEYPNSRKNLINLTCSS